MSQKTLLIIETIKAMKEVIQELHDIESDVTYTTKCKFCGFSINSSVPHDENCKWAKLQNLCDSL